MILAHGGLALKEMVVYTQEFFTAFLLTNIFGFLKNIIEKIK